MKVISKIFVLLLLFSYSVVFADQLESASQKDKIAKTRAILVHNKQAQDQSVKEKGLTNAWGDVEEVSVLKSGSSVMKGLMLCIGLLLLISGVMKKFRSKVAIANHKRIHILEKQSISSKSALLLIEVDDQKYLVSTGSEQVNFCNIPKRYSLKQQVETYKDVQCVEEKKLAI